MNSMVDVLNGLLAAEQRAITPRLFESTVFVSRASIRDERLASRLTEANASNGARLAGLIVERGGTPAPRQPDVMTADLHYLDLHFVLPRLIADHERLLALYRAASSKLASDRQAAELVARITADHERELSDLRTLAGPRVASPATRAS